jgi:hypothetical protein
MTLSMNDQAGDLKSRLGETIENEEDFINCSSWINQGTEPSIKV